MLKRPAPRRINIFCFLFLLFFCVLLGTSLGGGGGSGLGTAGTSSTLEVGLEVALSGVLAGATEATAGTSRALRALTGRLAGLALEGRGDDLGGEVKLWAG